jgi:ribonuclease HII
VASATVEEIDALNILQATLLAMRRAVEALEFLPGEVLVDGTHCPRVGLPVRAIVKGDCTVAAISAASILAKTTRDAEMLRLHELHPHYGLDRHKGYPTKAHLAALHRHGVTAIHRKSFAPVRELIAREPFEPTNEQGEP